MSKFLIVKTGGTFAEYAAEHGDFEDWTAQGMGLEARPVGESTRPGRGVPAGPDWICRSRHHGVARHGHGGTGLDADHRSVDPQGRGGGPAHGRHLLRPSDHGQRSGWRSGLSPERPGDGSRGHLPSPKRAARTFSWPPLAPSFRGNMAHSQTVLKLPRGAVLLATGSHDPHQSYRVGEHAWGFQFHPEFNADAMRMYRRDQRCKAVAGGEGSGSAGHQG